MGFFNRSNPNKDNAPQTSASPAESAHVGTIKTQLNAANDKLKAKDLPGALAIYDELLRTAGDRPDVLVTISADLGTSGHIPQIIELIAPRYDAEKHGPATGINLLQAYLATNNTTAAQHLLDILFALNRSDLEERLYGFSNALAELIEAEKRGALPPPAGAGNATDDPSAAPQKSINLCSISRPIWSYGIENMPGVLPPPKQDRRLRRIAFAQISILGIPPDEVASKAKQPEDSLARLTRGLPLWLSETFYYSPHYNPIAALALFDRDHYAIFPIEWTVDHITQLANTSADGLDYVLTGTIQQKEDSAELLLRLWETKKMRVLKQFQFSWNPATMDAELARAHEQIRLFMEWQQQPGAPAYTAPASAAAWCDTLGASLSFFLAEKSTLPVAQIADPAGSISRAATRAAESERASLAYLTLCARAKTVGLSDALPSTAPALAHSPVVEKAAQSLS